LKKIRKKAKKLLKPNKSALKRMAKSRAGEIIWKTVYDTKWSVDPLTGDLKKKKVPREAAFKIVAVKKKVRDPLRPGKFTTITVDKEVPFDPAAKERARLMKLQEKMARLSAREHQMTKQYKEYLEARVDQPVLEDGAPAPPDAQEVEMAQQLYGEIEATGLKKAKSIKEAHIVSARNLLESIDPLRQSWYNKFDDWTKQKLVPKHAWY